MNNVALTKGYIYGYLEKQALSPLEQELAEEGKDVKLTRTDGTEEPLNAWKKDPVDWRVQGRKMETDVFGKNTPKTAKTPAQQDYWQNLFKQLKPYLPYVLGGGAAGGLAGYGLGGGKGAVTLGLLGALLGGGYKYYQDTYGKKRTSAAPPRPITPTVKKPIATAPKPRQGGNRPISV